MIFSKDTNLTRGYNDEQNCNKNSSPIIPALLGPLNEDKIHVRMLAGVELLTSGIDVQSRREMKRLEDSMPNAFPGCKFQRYTSLYISAAKDTTAATIRIIRVVS